jgi:hypothetical protein
LVSSLITVFQNLEGALTIHAIKTKKEWEDAVDVTVYDAVDWLSDDEE